MFDLKGIVMSATAETLIKARNEIFNVSNGDVYGWRQLWNELATFNELPIAEPLAMSTVSEMSEKAPLWDSMVARYGLHATPYDQIANWAFVGWKLNFRDETIPSAIKIRQAGFADCIDTHQTFSQQLTRPRPARHLLALLQPPRVDLSKTTWQPCASSSTKLRFRTKPSPRLKSTWNSRLCATRVA